MKVISRILLLVYLLINGSHAFSGVMIDGEYERLNHDDWVPKKVYLAFNYDSQGKIAGYRVAFQADKGQLFNEWKLKNDDLQTTMIFPFVLEPTLVILDTGEVNSSGDWGFGRIDGNNSGIPLSYKDSELLDPWEDNYGIGILNPHLLEGDIIYDYWMGLEPAKWSAKDPKKLIAFLRFRLNIDLSAVKKFGYTKDEIERDFKMGDLWRWGYDLVDTSKPYSANDIGERFSFAIEEINNAPTGNQYRPSIEYIYLDGTHGSEVGLNGQWCKTRGKPSVKKVSSLEECFGIKSTPPDPPAGIFTCEDVQDGFNLKVGTSIYPNQCVWYVRYETGLDYNCCNTSAKLCYDQAKACGYEVGQTPKLGSVMVLDGWKTNPDGHVGIVIGIDEKSHKIKLRHGNWDTNPNVSYVSENWVSTNAFPVKGYVYPQGEGCAGPGGSTNPDPSDPPASGKLPDFITNKVILAKENGKGERYTWKVNETAWVHAWVDNIGKANWEGKKDKIKVPFYLFKGTKEDRHSEWVRVGREEIKKKNVEVKDKPKHEKIAFNIQQWAAAGYIYPGRTYNFVVCADRPKDQDNGDGDVKEIHKSNNCSTEAVFYVDYGPARNVDVMASNLALAGGKSSLQAGEAYGFQADISNIGTEYPWNGCRTNYEIKGPGTGGVWQKVADEGSTVSQLGPNSTHVEVIDESRGLKAPSVGGDYVFRACADYEQTIPETDESNNCTAELPVTVTVPPPPAACVILNPLASLPATGSFDLAATSIEFPDVIQQGDEMHPKARLCGVSGTSPKTRATWAYANCDGTGFTAFDGDTDDGLSAGECVTEENKEGDDLANMPPGRYVMYFIANGETQVPESDHSNNVQAKEFVVE